MKIVVEKTSGVGVRGLWRWVLTMTGFLTCMVAIAQEGEMDSELQKHRADVEQMLVLMGIPQQVDEAAQGVLKIYTAKVSENNKDPNVVKMVGAYQAQVTTLIDSVFGWNGLRETYVDSYSKKLTSADVAAATEFLKSPSGEKFVSAQLQSFAEIQDTTTHLAESDLVPAVTALGEQLKEGILKLEQMNSDNK